MSSPSKTIVPDDAGRVPARTAMNVDFPAPFGPMSPVMRPGMISIDTPSTACMPSKWRWMSRAPSIGSLTGTFSHHPSRLFLDGERAGKDTTLLGHHPLGAEPQEAEDEEADANPFQSGDQVGRADVHPPQQPCDLLEADRHQESAKDCADVVASASDDDRSEQDDGLGVQPRRGRPDLEEADKDRPREAGDGSADDEDGHLQGARILAECAGRELVLPHRAKRATVGRVDDSRRDEPD